MYPIIENQNTKELNELKELMKKAKTVAHWNELREQAKQNFSPEIISMLDASGYISQVI